MKVPKYLTIIKNGLKLLRYRSSSITILVALSMALTPGDIAARAGQEALGYLGAAAGPLAAESAERIRDYVPGQSIPQLGIGVARQACRRYGDNPGGVSGVAAGGLERMCRPYLDDIGYGSGPVLAKPFEGGQCENIRYVFTFQGTLSNPPYNTGDVSTIMRGPLRIDRGLNPGDVCSDGSAYKRWTLRGYQGDAVGLWAGCGAGFSVVSVVPIDTEVPGGCGGPPPEIQPPVPPPTPGPTREPFSPGPGINVDIDLTIGPTGEITFNIGTGPIIINPFGGGGGGGGDDPGIDQPGTAPSSGLPPGDIGQPAAPVDTGPTGKASGCAPPNSVLVGVKVVILPPLPKVSQFDVEVWRGACYVYMGTLGHMALNPEGVALRSGQMLFAPLDNLTCWEVNANMNFILRVTPYYRALELETI